MPRLVALRPGTVVASVDLGYFAYRLEFMATMWDEAPCMSLVYAYPPSVPIVIRPQDGAVIPLSSTAVIALLRMPVEFAKSLDELAGVVKATNDSTTLEIAKLRATEAFTLFMNNPRMRKDTVDEMAKAFEGFIGVAWEIRTWIADGAVEKTRWETLNGVLVGIP